MTLGEQQELNLYRAEKARGLVHTPEWTQRMLRLEEKFEAGRALYRCVACNYHGLGAEFTALGEHCPNCRRFATAQLI